MQIDSTLSAIVIGLQAWSLKEIVSLKVSVATLTNEHIEMKKKIGVPLILIFALASIVLFAGCESTGGIAGSLGNLIAVPGKVLDKTVQSVTAITTNVTTSVLSSGEVVTTTNYTATASAPVAHGIEITKSITEWLPPQISGPASVILAGLSGVLTLAVRRRQAQIDKHEETIDTMSGDAMSLYDQLAATVRGVERSVKESKPVKEMIAKEAAKAGISEKLNANVQSIV